MAAESAGASVVGSVAESVVGSDCKLVVESAPQYQCNDTTEKPVSLSYNAYPCVSPHPLSLNVIQSNV